MVAAAGLTADQTPVMTVVHVTGREAAESRAANWADSLPSMGNSGSSSQGSCRELG